MNLKRKKTRLIGPLLASIFTLSLLSSCSKDRLVPTNNQLSNSGSGQLPVNNQNSFQANSVQGHVVVKFKRNMDKNAIINFANRERAKIVRVSSKLNIVVFNYLSSDTQRVISNLNNDPLVEYAEPNFRYSSKFTVNDPKSVEQSGLAIAGLAQAWDITLGDPRVVIAVVDTGVDLKHPDLRRKLVPGYNVITQGQTSPMDDNGHGTHVAGIAAADTDNGLGIAGAAPGCSVMPIKALDEQGGGNTANIAVGIVWAVDHGAKILNLSLGGPSDSKTLKRAIDYAFRNNTVVVAAMGNDSSRAKRFPAAYPGVISVGSVDFDRSRSSFSNWGDWISVTAPGSEIYSTMTSGPSFMTEHDGLSNDYEFLDGTSMAAPIVSGIVGLMLSRNPRSTPTEIKAKLESTARDLGDSGYDEEYGYGLVNAAKAVR